jgi:hypothetical protein
MFKTSKASKSAIKTDRKGKKGKKTDQQCQSSNNNEEEATQEELAYLETQARRYQVESDEEEEQDTGHYQEYDNESLAGEDEHLQSESRLKRTDQAEDARVSQADEDKLPSSPTKKRRQSQDKITGIPSRFRLSQAEKPQGPIYPNPDLTFGLPPSTSPSPDFVGANTQSVSSTSTYQGDLTSNGDDITLDHDLGRHGAVTGDGILNILPISRLERLIRVKSVSDNNQKLSRGLEIIRSQETISLSDPDLLALGLTEAQMEEITILYETDPQPIKLSGSSMLLTQDIKRLSRGYTTDNAVEFVQWVRSTDSGLKVNQLVDLHAKFSLETKFKSMAHRFGYLPDYFTGWYENWTLTKLADWVEKLYGNVSITTLAEELTGFRFNFKSKGMDLSNQKSRPSEDATFQRLNEILLKYPGPEFRTPQVQAELVKILKDKVKHTIFSQDMTKSSLPSSTVHEFILSLMSVREKIRGDFEGANR